MKKKYVKPEIIFEDFSLSTNIAAGCEYTEVTFSKGENGCGLEFGGDNIFLDGCGENVGPDDGNHNGICYHVPTENKNVFSS